jgi:hypothetical protein
MADAPSPQAEPLEALVRRVVAQVRWRRAEHYALRGLFWGAVSGVLALVLKVALGSWAPLMAGALVIVGGLGGVVWGLSRRVRPLEAARLADRAFGLQDRVATALEWGPREDRSALVETLVADARARVTGLAPGQVVPHVLPREVRWFPLPAAVALALALAPPLPLPSGRMFDVFPTPESEETRERTSGDLVQQDRRPAPQDQLRRSALQERDWAPRGAASGSPAAGDLSAIFKDTSLASQRPDFNSFLKTGDERLKMLEQVDRLPDLQSDFTASQHKMVFRKAKALRGGLKPEEISPQKLRELLEEMERLGRKGGADTGPDVSEGMEALEYGQQDKALEAMEKALNKLRALEEAQRSGRNLKGGREANRTGGREQERSLGSPDVDEGDQGEGEGLLPGKGRSPSPKGDATDRLQASPYDAGLEGEMRRGRKDAFDTNLTGRGGKTPSRLHYLGVIGQYRKAMEDTLAREQVPRDFHEQIRDYFQSLDER